MPNTYEITNGIISDMAQGTRQTTALPVCPVFGAPLKLPANVLLRTAML